MSSSFEKSVKGATKIKVRQFLGRKLSPKVWSWKRPPKTKYIEHILVGTHSGEAGIAEVFRALQNRLHDSTWTVVFKSLMTVHLMVREGSPEATLSYLSRHRNMLAISNFADAQTQGRNIRHYANYLIERVRAYRDTKTDWVRAPESRLERLTVDKGLLRETEIVQSQLTTLLKCDVLDTEPETEITIAVFRLLILDLLPLFQVLNQGLINILGHFFEMSKPDAERAMDVYRLFTKQTDYVVQFLSTAKQWQHHTRVEVPRLKHAPINLGRQLEEYLNDPDFEIHRRQYLAEQEAKRNGKGSSKLTFPKVSKSGIEFPKPSSPAANNPFPAPNDGRSTAPKVESKPQANKGPDPDLIDFFDSIEQNQTTMQVSAQPVPLQGQVVDAAFQQQTAGLAFQPTGFPGQPTGFVQANPFPQADNGAAYMQQQQIQQMQSGFAGAGFGGFAQQSGFQPGSLASIPQNQVADFQNQGLISTQPMMPQSVGVQPMQQPGQQAVTNPFRQSMMGSQQPVAQNDMSGFVSPPNTTPTLSRQSTNPFARGSPSQTPNQTPSQTSAPFQPAFNPALQTQQPPVQPQQPQPQQAQPTSTNPFARNMSPQAAMPAPDQQQQQQPTSVAPQPTGATNPFRLGAFVNHATGQPWQQNQTPIGGGLDQIPTVQAFPRPTQQTPWQQ
ncbi:ENTH domain-containing protein C19F8.03c [Cladobotryum mycophilum]|uniref:ENTH domain-containing protein C19F8.03c n=1 Tax=Cladobotryum mycophilum TaxID=491253 RepID=A0ABR0SJU8_9HYPO